MTDIADMIAFAKEWLTRTDATDGHLAADVLAEALITLAEKMPTAEEREALEWARRCVYWSESDNEARQDCAIGCLDRLLGFGE